MPFVTACRTVPTELAKIGVSFVLSHQVEAPSSLDLSLSLERLG
jgi:hypothetical protein